MLMTMSENPALLQKVLEDWLRLPERQELFAGLPTGPYGTIGEPRGLYGAEGSIWDHTGP